MKSFEVGGYRLLCDVETTRACYDETPKDSCTGPVAENYWLVQDELLDGEFGKILSELGIDPGKPAEYYIPIDPLLSEDPRRPANVIYRGWFHFVGEITVHRTPPPGGDVDPLLLGEAFWHFPHFLRGGLSIGFDERRDLAAEPFRDHKLVELGFSASLPCVVDGLM